MSKSKGLGDSIEKAIKTATFGKVKSCDSCKKRRDKLNKLFPYQQQQEKTPCPGCNKHKRKTPTKPGESIMIDYTQPNTINDNVKVASERWKAYLKNLHK
tara:strand:+ start:159 stop:458 length:300 start_codon:yes stop_codon:yes gene_type:complete